MTCPSNHPSRVAVLFLILPALFPPTARATAPEIVCEDPDLRARVTERVGPKDLPADASALEELVRGLHGAFPQIRLIWVEKAPGPGGTARLHVVPYQLIVGPTFKGNSHVRDVELASAVRLMPGEPFAPEKLSGVEAAVREVYRSYGYFDARAAVRTVATAKGIEIQVEVEENRRAEVRELRFEGEAAPLTEARLLGLARLRRGEPYDQDRIYRAVREITQAYFRRRFFRTKVETQEVLDAAGDVLLVFHVDRGKPFDLRLDGDPRSRDRDLLSYLDLEKVERYDTATLDEWKRAIRDGFQKRGYAFVKVDVRERDEGDRVTLAFIVEPGPKVAVRRVRISGNEQVVSTKILRRLETRPGSPFPFFSRGTLVDVDLRRDAERIQDYYRSHGYLEARVLSTAVERDPRIPVVEVAFTVYEGRQVRVARVGFEGLPEATEDDIRKELALRAGEPFDPNLIREDELRALRVLTSTGYLEAKVSGDYRIEDRPRQLGLTLLARPTRSDQAWADVVFAVEPGVRSFVGRFAVEPQGEFHKTQENVLLRELKIAPGDVISQQKLAEGQLRIYRLGFFREVRVVPSASLGPLSDGRRVRDVVVSYEERKAKEIAFGPGFDSDNLFGVFVEGSIRNLFGTGRSIGTRGQYTLRDQFYRATYTEPWVLGTDLTLRSSTSYELDKDTSGIGFDRREVAGTVGTEKRIGNVTLTVQERLARTVRVGDLVDEGRVDQKTLKSFLTPGIIYDRRDDFFNPETGFLLASDVDFAPAFLGSEVEFIRPTARAAHYLRLPAGLVLASGARGGWILPLTSLTVVEQEANEELFRLGGRDSLRGFGQGELGILHDEVFCASAEGETGTVPPGECPPDRQLVRTARLGGTLLAQGNEELRFPIPTFLPFRLGGAVFLDVGNVWRTQTQGPSNPLTLRSTAGFAFRIITPIGPISAYVAFNLRRKRILDVADPKTERIVVDGAERETIVGGEQISRREDAYKIGFAIGEFF